MLDARFHLSARRAAYPESAGRRAFTARGLALVCVVLASQAPLALAAQSAVRANASVPVELSLTEAMSRALAKNLDLRVIRADTGFAFAQLIGARLRPNPALAVETRTSGDANAGRLEGETSVSYTQELQLWGVRDNRIREASLEQERTRYAARDAARLVQREVAASYRELVFQRERVALLDSLVRVNARISRAAQLAFQQALGSELDARLSDAATRQAALERDRALRENEIARLQFAKLLGDSLRTVYALRDSVAPARLRFLVVRPVAAAPADAGVQFDVAAADIDSLIGAALAIRPDVRAAEYAVQVSNASHAVALSRARPTVAVGGLFARARDNFALGAQQGTSLAQSVGIGVVIGLPVNNRNQGETTRAEFAIAAASLRLANVRITVERDVRVAAERVALAASQIETFRQTILPTSTAALRLAEAAFARGQVSIFQVLQVQRTYVESTTGLLEASRQYAAALADLEAALGQPVP